MLKINYLSSVFQHLKSYQPLHSRSCWSRMVFRSLTTISPNKSHAPAGLQILTLLVSYELLWKYNSMFLCSVI